MKSIVCILLLSCIVLTIALADIVYMKNGLEIEGEILSVGSDSVTIKTASGVLTIAAADIERISTAEVAKAEPERYVSERASRGQSRPLVMAASAVP
jgi:hypothetical protein